jgi:hypothetical protein
LVTTLMQADSFQQRIEDEMTAILDKWLYPFSYLDFFFFSIFIIWITLFVVNSFIMGLHAADWQ